VFSSLKTGMIMLSFFMKLLRCKPKKKSWFGE